MLLSGIYQLKINGLRYIGYSHDIENRLNVHWKKLLDGKHNSRAQQAFEQSPYLDYEILGLIYDLEDLPRIERYYIEWLQPELNIDKLYRPIKDNVLKAMIERRVTPQEKPKYRTIVLV